MMKKKGEGEGGREELEGQLLGKEF